MAVKTIRRSLKRLAALIIAAVILLVPAPVYVSASEENAPHYENAVDLKLLGLFEGTANGFELEHSATRIEGAVMLVRLLGKEQYAIQSRFSHPFRDVPSWADAYIGYMYKTGITTGISADAYGSDIPITATQYAAFVLRALGYSEGANDFKYAASLEKARDIGIIDSISAKNLANSKTLTRDIVVMMSYNTLNARLKGFSSTLLDKLVTEDKAVSETTAEILGLYTSRLANLYSLNSSFKPAASKYGLTVKSGSELAVVLSRTISTLQPQVKIDIRKYGGDIYKDIAKLLDTVVDPVSKETGVTDLIKSWQYNGTNTSLTLNITYRYSKTAFAAEQKNYKAAVNKARHIAVKLSRSMTDFDKELKLHDYIVNNCSYDYEGYKAGKISGNSYKLYGCLILGKAVCEGYSKAMKLLCDLSGVECMVIRGKSYSSGGWQNHSWNLIKLENDYYHLDTTFDDPITDNGKGTLSHCYFNLSDSEIKLSYQWDTAAYPACKSTKFNYYSANNLVVGNKAELQALIQREAADHKSSMELKIAGFTPSGYTDLKKIISNASNASKFYYSVDERFGIVEISGLEYAK